MRVISTSGVSPMSERIAGGLFRAGGGAVGISNILKQTEYFARIIDHDFVVAQEIITHDTIKFRANCAAQHRKKIGHYDIHIIDIGTAKRERLHRTDSDINPCAPGCGWANR